MNPFDPHYILFKQPLYNPIVIEADLINDFIALMKFDGQIEEYSVKLKENTSYKVNRKPSNSVNHPDRIFSYSGLILFELVCVRTKEYARFFFNVSDQLKPDVGTIYTIEKIGQMPSIADIEIGQIKDYSHVLPKEKLNEFTKAVGLIAHGIGIGSFVYLRRIFEYLIQEAYEKAKAQSDWNEEKYSSSRMNEKIGLLKNYLPEFLVENRQMYGILSIGVHSLSEQECLEHFDAVKIGIELILDEKLDEYNKLKKTEAAKKKLLLVAEKLK